MLGMVTKSISEDALAKALHEIDDQGYTVLADVIPDKLLDEVGEALLKLERDLEIVPAPNEFEGRQTIRIYNLLAHGEPFSKIPIVPAVLPVVEGVLDDGCLISTLSSISIGKRETAQPIHADDQVIGLKRPHAALVCNTMWAITDFTEANGATRIVPGSHRNPEWPVYGSQEIESIPAEMKRGSVLVWIHPSAGKSTIGNPAQGGGRVSQAFATSDRLRRVSKSDRPHRQEGPARTSRRRGSHALDLG